MLFSDCSDRIPFVGILWLVKFLLWKTSGHHHAMYVDFFFCLRHVKSSPYRNVAVTVVETDKETRRDSR